VALQRKLYKANPQRAVSGGQLALYSRGRFAEEAIQGESSNNPTQTWWGTKQMHLDALIIFLIE